MGEIITAGSIWAALPLALLAGLVSFASPCVLPLVPGYLGYLTGTTTTAGVSRWRALAGTGLAEERGFLVTDACLRTSDARVFAAGDCATMAGAASAG